MRINILTLFPEIIKLYSSTSIVGRAVKENLVDINIYDLRKFGIGQRKDVDGKQFGGGGGMVLRVDVIDKAIKKIKADDPLTKIILLCPTGKTYDQAKAIRLSKQKSITLIAGHYQGYDKRVYALCDDILSIGDYITTGGETAAMSILDSVTRLLPEVINPNSLKNETFSDDMTEAPLYTEPADFNGQKVPEILLGGHHQNIKLFRSNNRKKMSPENPQKIS